MTTLPFLVALILGGAGVYVAYRNPNLGAALLVGVAILTGLYVVLEKDPNVFPADAPPSPVAPARVPDEGLPAQQAPPPATSADSAPSAGAAAPAP